MQHVKGLENTNVFEKRKVLCRKLCLQGAFHKITVS